MIITDCDELLGKEKRRYVILFGAAKDEMGKWLHLWGSRKASLRRWPEMKGGVSYVKGQLSKTEETIGSKALRQEWTQRILFSFQILGDFPEFYAIDF